MIRTQIQLEREQYERLKELAVRQSKSFSQVVREGVDRLLAAERVETAWDRFSSAVGSFRAEDDAADVAERHDAYLVDACSRASSRE